MPALLPGTFDELAEPRSWNRLHEHVRPRRLLHADGSSNDVGEPQRASPAFVERARALVAGFDRFYRALAKRYFDDDSQRPRHLVNDTFAPIVQTFAELPTTLLCRFDCVLDEVGQLRVIENNSVGICLFQLRNPIYLDWAARRYAEDELGAHFRRSTRRTARAFASCLEGLRGQPVERATVGILRPRNQYRSSALALSGMFPEIGWHGVPGTVRDIEIHRDRITMRGQTLDVLWADLLFYFGYQQSRYDQTRFKTRVGSFASTPTQSMELLKNDRFIGLVRDRKIALLSPMSSYVLLAKTLLAHVDNEDLLDAPDRLFLREHVARTYDLEARRRGSLTLDEARARQHDLVLKPCLYGGGHGVLIGRDLEPAAWSSQLEQHWDAQDWALQEYHEPVRGSDGRYLSIGLYNFAGELGPIAVRASSGRLIGAREADYIEATF